MRHHPLPVETIRSLFIIDAQGVIRNRVRRSQRGHKNAVSGGHHIEGYIRIAFGRGRVFAHRIAWVLYHGEDPGHQQVDHINGDRLDNRVSNLRLVDDGENKKNAAMRSDNKSGCTGVSWCSRTNKWSAAICHNRKSIFLGRFTNKSDAIKARRDANVEYGFHPNHGRKAV